MTKIDFDNVWTIGNGDEQVKLFKEIKQYCRKNEFLIEYDSKPIINAKNIIT